MPLCGRSRELSGSVREIGLRTFGFATAGRHAEDSNAVSCITRHQDARLKTSAIAKNATWQMEWTFDCCQIG